MTRSVRRKRVFTRIVVVLLVIVAVVSVGRFLLGRERVAYIERITGSTVQDVDDAEVVSQWETVDLGDVSAFTVGNLAVTIDEVQRETLIGNEVGKFETKGLFYIVHLTITNTGSIDEVIPVMYLADDQGKRYGIPIVMQEKFKRIARGTIKAGESAARFAVFDIPLEANGLRLEILYEGKGYRAKV